MANVSRKQLSKQIRELLERKGDIQRRSGGLIPYLTRELKLTGNSTIREPINEAILLLEEQGLIEVVRRGTVIEAIKRTKRQRAIPHTNTSSQEKETAIPVATQAPVKHPYQLAKHTTEAVRVAMEAPTVSFGDAPLLTMDPKGSSVKPANTVKPLVLPPKKPGALKLIETLTARGEQLKQQLVTERAKREAVERAKQEADTKLREEVRRNRTLEQEINAEKATTHGLRAELASANTSMQEGLSVLDAMQTSSRARESELEEKDRIIEELQARNRELESRDDLSDLASRIGNLLSD